jgi:hypothetical protein
METINKQQFHFYASSHYDWRINTDIRKLIKEMDKLKNPYVLFYMPIPIETDYEIYFYVPRVKEKIYLGSSDSKIIYYINNQ